MAPYRLVVNNRSLQVVLNTASLNLTAPQLTYLGLAIRDTGAKVQARAVRNVSGYPVQYDGKVFRVVVRTGTLKGAIELTWPYQSALQARVYVNGAHTAAPTSIGGLVVRAQPVSKYAAAIEFGHKEIDLKQYMQGKTVPFFASRSSSSTGPYSVRGLTPIPDASGDQWENKDLNRLLAHRGQKPMSFQRRKARAYSAQKNGAGSYYIAFRKVGKKGWIIPAAKPRPFMAAAGTGPATQRDVRSNVSQRYRDLIANAARSR